MGAEVTETSQSKSYCYRRWVANNATCDMVCLEGENLPVC